MLATLHHARAMLTLAGTLVERLALLEREQGAQLLIHFADVDERINAAWPAYESALQAAGARFEAHLYPGTQHGFHNDTTPRYDEAAAKLAWQRTLDFLARQLKR